MIKRILKKKKQITNKKKNYFDPENFLLKLEKKVENNMYLLRKVRFLKAQLFENKILQLKKSNSQKKIILKKNLNFYKIVFNLALKEFFDPNFINPTILNTNKSKFVLTIHVCSNNTFIIFSKILKKKFSTIKVWSSGTLKMHCSKKQLKFVIYTLLKYIKNKIKKIKLFLIRISSAHFLHKYIFKQLKKIAVTSTFLLFTSFKIFNGCRLKKKQRKKHLKLYL